MQLEDVANAEVQYSKALNRSVIGSMNDLVYHAKLWLLELPILHVASKLNDIPWSSLKYRTTTEYLRSLLGSSSAFVY